MPQASQFINKKTSLESSRTQSYQPRKTHNKIFRKCVLYNNTEDKGVSISFLFIWDSTTMCAAALHLASH